MSTDPFYGSQAPVFKVGDEVKGELARDLTRVEVEETVDGLKTLSASFGNWGPRPGNPEPGFRYLDGAILDFGKKLEVSVGPQNAARVIFTGLISALEVQLTEGGEPLMVVLAEDKLMDLRMTRRFKTYQDKSDADIASDIASANGLQADVDATGPTYKVVQQWNQSDLAFLRERARRLQAEVWIADDKLCFKTRGSRTGTELTLVQGSDLLSLSIRADLSHQRTKVRTSGYDAQARDVIDEEAGADVIRGEISGGKVGPEILQSAFGDRVSYGTRDVPLTGEEARAWAKAEMLRRARAFVSAAGVARGQPDLIVGTKLTLDRVGAPFEGPGYYVTRVRHRYDLGTGFRSTFEAERATLNEGNS
jgi:phage protein D